MAFLRRPDRSPIWTTLATRTMVTRAAVMAIKRIKRCRKVERIGSLSRLTYQNRIGDVNEDRPRVDPRDDMTTTMMTIMIVGRHVIRVIVPRHAGVTLIRVAVGGRIQLIDVIGIHGNGIATVVIVDRHHDPETAIVSGVQ